MSELIINLEDAVRDFILSLNAAEKETVRQLILNPQVKPSLYWYRRVSSKYFQGPSALLLIEDISRRYADEAVWRNLDSPQGSSFFEAGIVLRESQVALGSTTSA